MRRGVSRARKACVTVKTGRTRLFWVKKKKCCLTNHTSPNEHEFTSVELKRHCWRFVLRAMLNGNLPNGNISGKARRPRVESSTSVEQRQHMLFTWCVKWTRELWFDIQTVNSWRTSKLFLQFEGPSCNSIRFSGFSVRAYPCLLPLSCGNHQAERLN